MLLSSRMASIPCSSRHSVSFMRDLRDLLQHRATDVPCQAPPQPAALQYFNMRVTARLHRYRSLKRQWQETANLVQSLSPSPEPSQPPFDGSPSAQETTKPAVGITQKQIIESKAYCLNDYISATSTVKDNNDKSPLEFDPLHLRIQQDLIKLRKLIRARQKKQVGDGGVTGGKRSTSSRPSGESATLSTPFDDQDGANNNTNNNSSNNNGGKQISLPKLRPLDRVKIAGCQMRAPPSNEATDSGIGTASNSSSTCSQYGKQPQNIKRQGTSKTFNILRSRINPPQGSNSSIPKLAPPKKKLNISPKMTESVNLKPASHTPLPAPPPPLPLPPPPLPPLKKKQTNFVKREPLASTARRPSVIPETTTRLYSYAASSSTSTPRSMILDRNSSLFRVLFSSSSCMGSRPRQSRSKLNSGNDDDEEEEEEEKGNNSAGDDDDDDSDYRDLLEYKRLLNELPKPIVSIRPRCGQDDYGILFEQLHHIRQTMPDCNVYDAYARTI